MKDVPRHTGYDWGNKKRDNRGTRSLRHWWGTAVNQWGPSPIFPLHVTLSLLCQTKHHIIITQSRSHSPPSTPHSSQLSASSMASSGLTLLVSLVLCVCLSRIVVATQMDETSFKLMSDALDWPTTMSIHDELEDAGEEDVDGGFGRRSLFWQRMRYYISYGALSANRIPCPPRSGRSYYTHDCFKARGPVHPYSRGCSMITRCRRWIGSLIS